MIVIQKEQALRLHTYLVRETGGDAGVRDHALLDSALASPFQTFGGEELYPSLVEKAARLGFALIANHALIDGNKRIGMLVMLVFLEANGMPVQATNEEITRVGLSVAAGEMDYEALVAFLSAHTSCAL